MHELKNYLSIDNFISYPIAKKIVPILFKLNITPNMLTSFNILFRIFILFNFFKNNYFNKYLFGFLFITNFIDILDGTLAREFNLQTKLGALLDHISDKIFWSILLILILYSCKNNLLNLSIIFIISILLAFSVILGSILNNKILQDIIDNNAFLIITIIYFIYKPCKPY